MVSEAGMRREKMEEIRSGSSRGKIWEVSGRYVRELVRNLRKM